MKKVLITGGAGLLGINWGQCIKNKHRVVLGLHDTKVTLKGIETLNMDIESEEAARYSIDKISPDLVIHAAGMTSVDLCEKNPETAEYVNCTLSKNIAIICKEKKIKLLHISTDHLYDGIKKNITETETPSPLNVYGKTKLNGERAIASIYPETLIIRTNFFGWGGPNKQSFSDWIIYNLRKGNKIKAFDDVFYTPILIDRLVEVSMKLVDNNITGIVNIVGDERISKYEFCKKIQMHFDLPENLIEKAKIKDVDSLTLRPLDMSLSNHYVQMLYGEKMGGVDEFIRVLKYQEDTGRPQIFKEAF